MSKKKIILLVAVFIIIIILTILAVVKIKNKRISNQSNEITPDNIAPIIVYGG